MADSPDPTHVPKRSGSVERRRIIALAERLRAARNAALALLLPTLVATTFAYGPLILVFVGLLLAGFAAVGPAIRRSSRPERPLLASMLWAQAMLVGAMAVAERYQVDALGLLILPAVAVCLLFPARTAAWFLGWTTALMVGAAFAIDGARVADAPPIVFLPVGVLLCVALPAIGVRRLEIASRDSAMLDPLTGALNRTALELRLAELTSQARHLPLQVGVVMLDLDHFKAINDDLGHAEGDRVLCGAVRRMRQELGPLTPVYRAGGEEFVIVLAGADRETAVEVAERLRARVSAAPLGERTVTVSAGAAATLLDGSAATDLVNAADGALYDAKRSGRDCVVGSSFTGKTRAVAIAPTDEPEAAADAATSDLQVLPPPAGSLDIHAEAIDAPAAAFDLDGANWLVRGEFEREHIRSSARAMAHTHHGALGMIGLALAASIPWLGWHLMVPAILPVIAYHVVERRIRVIRRPEFVLGAAWLAVQLGIFGGALIVQPGEPFMLVLFAPMMIGVAATFPSRGILVASFISAALLSIGGAFARPELVTAYPGLLGPPVLLVAGLGLMSSAAGRSTIDFSVRAVVDPLTRLLTRGALQDRLAELAQQTAFESAEVSLIAFDVDEFKQINDTHGHEAGDAVLRAVGAAVRRHLRALEWAFRLGGDEFLIVVPAGEASAARLASTLRAAVAGIEIGGRGLTGSFGVAALAAGDRFDFDALSARADAALYEAKRAGRNRVAVAPLGQAAESAPRVLPNVA
ncbi:MAG: GGDEF domain-containing protein [Solirubrobacteraceae bacterium]|nr:GGDEF domain-containing protein [Solirubrobacteraceae bacterium]